jgi:2-amino-4-hydroxy-6-hydroxymethyldihydropteridine diphosphokinase
MSERRANRAYLSLGSNIEPEQNLPAAVRELAAFGRVLAVSSVWESAPFENDGATDRTEHPPGKNFLNAAVLLETELSAARIYDEAIPGIEQQLGRVRDPHDKNAPRTIDVDLSLFNRDAFELGGHRIPDPDIAKRPFVAVPLAELDRDYVHPTLGRTLADIAASWTTHPGLRPRPDVRLC